MTERTVLKVVEAREALEGAGVRIRRSLGIPELDHLDPFLLLDEFKSERSADYAAGFPDHPHRGFETVTYMLAGAMEHRDHVGHHGLLGPGSVQWMTAGRGIIHSEMPRQRDGLMWGFQLWVNLPAKNKLDPPRYQDIPPERIPEYQREGGARVRVVAGSSGERRGPVAGIVTDPLYLDVQVPPGARFAHEIPPGHNAFVYVFDGEGDFGPAAHGPGRRLAAQQLGVLGEGDALTVVTAGAPARFLLLAARPLGEPVARHGPFVMNTRAEIRQAMEDLESGRFLG